MLNEDENIFVTLFSVMVAIIGMALLGMIVFPFMDGFINIISGLNLPLSIWGQAMMNNLVIRFSSWIYIIPGLFCLIAFIWGVKTIIKRHTYTAQEGQQYMNDEFN